MLKKILCILLSFLLVFNNFMCVYADDFGGSSGSFGTSTTIPEPASKKFVTFLNALMGFSMYPDASSALGLSLFKGLSDDDKDNLAKEATQNNNVTQDDNNYYINANFFKTVNQKVQSNVHALDGYYLIEPQYSYNKKVLEDKIYEYTNCTDPANYSSFSDLYNKYDTMFLYPESRYTGGYVYGFDYFHGKYYYYCDASGDVCRINPSTPSSVYNTVYVYTPVGCTRVYPL